MTEYGIGRERVVWDMLMWLTELGNVTGVTGLESWDASKSDQPSTRTIRTWRFPVFAPHSFLSLGVLFACFPRSLFRLISSINISPVRSLVFGVGKEQKMKLKIIHIILLSSLRTPATSVPSGCLIFWFSNPFFSFLIRSSGSNPFQKHFSVPNLDWVRAMQLRVLRAHSGPASSTDQRWLCQAILVLPSAVSKFSFCKNRGLPKKKENIFLLLKKFKFTKKVYSYFCICKIHAWIKPSPEDLLYSYV